MKKLLWFARGLAVALVVVLLPGLQGGGAEPAAVAQAAASAAPSTECGGIPAMWSPQGTWTCRFSDDFSGTTVDRSKWLVQHTAVTGWRSGRECYMNDPDNVRVSGGLLSLTAREEAGGLFLCPTPGGGGYWTRVTSGMLTTWGRFQQTYGRWEIRAKFPSVTTRGVHSALWLWPRTQSYGAWPGSGEIDIAEFYTAKPDRAIPYIHYRKARWDPSVTSWSCLVDPTRFQTYRLDWTRSTLTISIDGKICVQHVINARAPLARPAPFDKPFFLALTQALGIGQNGYSSWTTKLPATMQIDWVRVWG